MAYPLLWIWVTPYHTIQKQKLKHRALWRTRASARRETIWKPPESVSRLLGQAMNLCSPPISSSSSVPGCWGACVCVWTCYWPAWSVGMGGPTPTECIVRSAHIYLQSEMIGVAEDDLRAQLRVQLCVDGALLVAQWGSRSGQGPTYDYTNVGYYHTPTPTHQLLGGDALDGALGAHGHEDGRGKRPVGKVDGGGARAVPAGVHLYIHCAHSVC